MLGQLGKSEIKLNCTEQALSEFPNLLFGTQTESGKDFFDATVYLQKSLSQKTVKAFFAEYAKPVEALCEAYDIAPDRACLINQQGHFLIDGNLTYLFIAFVEPNFLGYICDRIHELFTYGVTVSDTYLLQATKERLSPEVIKAIIAHGEKETE